MTNFPWVNLENALIFLPTFEGVFGIYFTQNGWLNVFDLKVGIFSHVLCINVHNFIYSNRAVFCKSYNFVVMHTKHKRYCFGLIHFK